MEVEPTGSKNPCSQSIYTPAYSILIYKWLCISFYKTLTHTPDKAVTFMYCTAIHPVLLSIQYAHKSFNTYYICQGM